MDFLCFQNSWVTGSHGTQANATADWASHMCFVSSQLGRKWFCQICWSDSNVAMGLKFCWSRISFITKVFSLYIPKGRLISKSLFCVFTFFQKTNENKSTSSKVEFVRSFFGRNFSWKKSFRICLTFDNTGCPSN